MPGLYWLTKILSIATHNRGVLAAFFAFLVWFSGIVEVMVVGAFARIVELMDSLDTSGFHTVSLSTVEWMGYINAVFPVAEVVALLASFYAAWVIIILIRWVKSFVPTVSN